MSQAVQAIDELSVAATQSATILVNRLLSVKDISF